jgi:hypothetical protein
MRPILRSHKEPSINYNNGVQWDVSQLPYVFRSYGEDGKLSVVKSLFILNRQYYNYLNITVTELKQYDPLS